MSLRTFDSATKNLVVRIKRSLHSENEILRGADGPEHVEGLRMTEKRNSPLCIVILRSEATKNLVVGIERSLHSENEILRLSQDDRKRE